MLWRMENKLESMNTTSRLIDNQLRWDQTGNITELLLPSIGLLKVKELESRAALGDAFHSV